MHHWRAFPLLFLLLSLPANLSVGESFARKRDISATSNTQDALVTTKTTASISSPTSGSSDANVPNTTSTTSMIDIHTDLSNPQPTLESSPSITNTNNGTVDGNNLPIQPTITPAIGITGVVLIVTGLAYSLIGIKNQWLHVFLSAAFLTSLSVIVLIEYVMTPPVSNAVQGVYFVAAFFTGVIFGALSLIFKELTEGLGCLLGGFCLSMWLLSLKSGSLLASSGIRGAFIGAFCVAFYALSFSSYTKPYALIASTAFAGSTAAVLGIDCFSRAGWKEFWLYIWGLNDNLFPSSPSTYPVTRGIRVELAVTIVICSLGLLSQFRLWKLIRERRKKQEQILAEERRKKDEAEMELGRAIEEKKQNDLVHWEAMYGDPLNSHSTAVQSPVSEIHKAHSMKEELIEGPDNSVEMTDLPTSANDAVTDKDTVKNGRQHEVDSHDIQKNEVAEEKFRKTIDCTAGPNDIEETVQIGSGLSPECTAGPGDLEKTVQKDSELSPESPQPPPPWITPLPFKIPLGSTPRNGDDDDDNSIQAIVDDADTASVHTSKRLSAASLFRRLSHRNNAGTRSRLVQSDSNEMLVPSSPVSSVTTSQGLADSEAGSILEERQSIEMEIQLHDVSFAKDTGPNDPRFNTSRELAEKVEDAKAASHDTSQFESKTKVTPWIEDRSPTEIGQVEENSGIVFERRRHTIDGVTSILPIKALSLAPVTTPLSKTSETTLEKDARAGKPAALSSPKSKSSVRKKENLTSEVVKKLPSHVSPVVISYRTNEWAKHLSHADAPEHEPLAELVADTEHPISPEDIEIAAPLNIEELKQTSLTATPPPANGKWMSLSRSTVQRPISNVSRQSASDANSRHLAEDYSLGASTLKPTSEMVGPSSPPLLYSPIRSPPPTRATPGGLRSVSSPYLSTLAVTSPIQNVEARHSAGQVIEDGPSSLMAQREKMIRARFSSISLTRESWATRNTSERSIVEEGYQPRPGSQLSLVEDDDVPLTQRRALLQHHKATSPRGGHDTEAQGSPIDGQNSTTARLSRDTSKPKVATMAAWRESLQEDMTKHKPSLEVDIAQNELMERQRREQLARTQRIMTSENLDKSIAERMRHGNMQDLHREAMRRMQATANRTMNGP